MRRTLQPMNAQSMTPHATKAIAGVAREMSSLDLDLFEAARSGLTAMAYRLLGSRADAEDAVQDCFLKWRAANRAAIASPIGWLATICNHRCLDLLRSTWYSRVDHVGTSISAEVEPIAQESSDGDFSAAVTTAFDRMLQRLTPKERAVYVLHDIFEQSIAATAATLQMSEGACQKLVERARTHIARKRVRCVAPTSVQNRLLRAFQSAIATGDPAQLALLLARDAHTKGGNARGALRVLRDRKQLRHDHTHTLHGDHADEIANTPDIDHRCKRQDRRSSQRAA